MKRRDFLKFIGVAIVAPGTAVAAVKAGLKWGIDPSKPYRWKNYGVTYKFKPFPTEADREKFRRAFKKHKFQKPCNFGTKRIIIYDEFDYTTVNFLKKHRINIKRD